MRHLVFALLMALLLSTLAAGASGSGLPAFITDAATNTLLQVNTTTKVVDTAVHVGSNPFGVAVLPDGSRVYVTNWGLRSTSVSVVNIVGGMLSGTPRAITVGRMPLGVVATADGKQVFVTNFLSGSMSVIDTATETVVRTISVGSLPRGVVANPRKPYVYVGSQATDDVAFVNTTDFSIVRAPAGADPFGVAVDPSGKILYVALEGEAPGKLLIMDAASGAILDIVPVGSGPTGVAVSPDGKRVYVANKNTGTVSVVDAVSRTWVRDVTVGAMPVGVSVSSDGGRVYVANSNGASLSVINTTSFVVDTIALAGSSPIAFGNSLLPGPNVIAVTIDIVPDIVNLKKQGTVPVIIYGSESFQVHDLGPAELLTIHLNGWPVKVKPNGEPMANYGDFNGDGLDDVMVHISMGGAVDAQATSSDSATLEGQTSDGMSFQGTDSVKFLH